MLSAEKALYLNLCSGLSVGYQWLGGQTISIDEESIPDTVLLEGRHLAELAALYASGDKDTSEIVEGIIEKAEEVIKQPVTSVTYKKDNAYHKSVHDYYSLAKYWWPNLNQENGLPYERRDGEVNPECYSEEFDNARFVFMTESVQVLSLAAYLTKKPIWIEHVVKQLRVWFLDPATRQNPHFQHAQTIPGRSAVRSTGIVESRHLIYVTEAIYILESLNALPIDISGGMRRWFSELLEWMRYSSNGRSADRAKNNVAFWYDLQCLSYAWFVNNTELAEHILINRVPAHVLEQIEPDGSLPREIDRANPLDYVVFTLAAMSQISRYGDRLGIPVWKQADADGRSFQAANEWLLQHAKVREGRAAVRRLTAVERREDPVEVSDLVIQLALIKRVAKARGRMLGERDRWRKLQVKYIADLEKSLEKSEGKVREKEKQLRESFKTNDKQSEEREKKLSDSLGECEKEKIEWLEKQILKTQEDRIESLQEEIKERDIVKKSEEKYEVMKEKLQNQKDEILSLTSRFNDVRRQFSTMAEEKEKEFDAKLRESEQKIKETGKENSDLIDENKRLREKLNLFGELLKKSEKELEKVVEVYREDNGQNIDAKKIELQQQKEIKKIKQEHRSETKSQQRKIDRLQKGLDHQKFRANYFKERSDKILRSRSWRLTALFRKMVNLLEKKEQVTEKKR